VSADSTNGAWWVFAFDASRSSGARWASELGIQRGNGSQKAGSSVALSGSGLVLAVGGWHAVHTAGCVSSLCPSGS